MAERVVYMTGDQIATYTSLSSQGNNDAMQVQINGAQTLGSQTDVFRIVIRQVNSGESEFSNGQFVDIYAYPESATPPVPLFSNLNPQHDQFQGRASSDMHQIFTQPAKIIFDVNGFPDAPNFSYGPGANPPRSEKLDFDAFADAPPSVPCFVKGTRIDTDHGPRPIETLKIGDLVRTASNGLQAIRWIGSRTVPGIGSFAPITFAPGALENTATLRVSPQHRMLVTDWRTEIYFGAEHALIAAKHLVNGSTIRQTPCDAVSYFHIACDAHEMFFAEGTPSETLHLGKTAFASLPKDARDEITSLFPELDMSHSLTAHTCLSAWESHLLT